MPYQKHIRVTAVGKLGAATDERFAFSLNMSAPFADSTLQGVAGLDDDWFTDVATDIAEFLGRADTAVSNRVQLEAVKFALIGVNGKYLDPEPKIVPMVATGSVGGTQGPNFVTPQTALAVTLDTDHYGPSGRGRFFLPMPAVPLDDSLLVNLPWAEGIRASVKTLIDDMNNAPGFDGVAPEVIVASGKVGNNAVTSVRIGRVLDTVRSRRKQLKENYTAPATIA